MPDADRHAGRVVGAAVVTCPHVLGRLFGGPCPLCSGAIVARVEAGVAHEVDHRRPTPASAFLHAGLPSAGSAEAGEPSGNWVDDEDMSPEQAIADAELHDALAGLDPEEVEQFLRDLDADAYRSSLSEFVKGAFPTVRPGVELEWGPHLQAVCDHVQWQLEDRSAVARDRTKKRKLKCENLLINVPPRSLKTIILTLATVWAWLRWPTLRILYLSANPRVASQSARMARDLMRSQWFKTTFASSWDAEERDSKGRVLDPDAWDAAQWHDGMTDEAVKEWEIRADQDALSDLGNTSGGVRKARGMAATITGDGAEWLVIDDPHDARDSTARVAKAVEEYESAIHSRADDPRTSIRTMIMQRIKPNDLSARWIEILTNLTHVRLPTEYESPERAECTCGTCTERNVFGFLDWRTREGERLHARFTDEFVAEARRVLASKFDGQHQQRPAAAGGLIFKVGNWSWYSLTSTFVSATRPKDAKQDPPYLLTRRLKDPTSLEVDYVDLSIDATGGSADESASALGITAWAGKAERRFMLRDFTPGPATWLQTMRYVVDALRATVKIAGKQRLYTVIIEKKALGAALIGQLEQAVHDGEIRYSDGSPVKVRVEAYEPQGSKEDRADAAEPDQAAGLIYLLDGDPGNTGPWRDEVEGFPRAQRDDRVDSMSQALDYRRETKTGWVELFKKKRAEERERRAASTT
jgi:hypothetical protein